MVDVPISWKISITGATEAKRQLAALQDEFGRDDGLKRFNQQVRTGTAETNAIARAVSYSNRAFRVQHQSLYEAGKAFRIFGSAMRSAMSIMNSLNLITTAQSTQQTSLRSNIADLKTDLTSLDLELSELEKHGKKNSIEYQLRLNEKQKILNDIKDVEKQLEETTKNETWQKWLTAGFAIEEGVSAMFAILNNPQIGPKVISAFSNIFAPLGKTISGWGIAHGTLYGTSLLAGMAGAITGAALGTILFDPIDKWLRDNIPGYKGFAEARDIESQKNADFIFGKDSQTKKDLQTNAPGWFGPSGNAGGKSQLEGIADWFKNIFNIPSAFGSGGGMQGPSQVVGPMGNLVNIFGSKPLPVKVVTSGGMAGFRDLGGDNGTSGILKITTDNTDTTETNTETINISTQTQKENIKTQKEIDTENARRHHEAEMSALAAKQALFDNTDALYHLALINGTAKPPSAGGGGSSRDTSQEGHNVTGGLHGGNPSTSIDRGHNASNDIPGNRNQETGAYGYTINPVMTSRLQEPSITIINQISGSVVAEKQVEQIAMNALKDGLKRVGF